MIFVAGTADEFPLVTAGDDIEAAVDFIDINEGNPEFDDMSMVRRLSKVLAVRM